MNTLCKSFKILIITTSTIFVLIAICVLLDYAQKERDLMLPLNKEVLFDVSYLNDENKVRSMKNIEKCNTVTLQINSFTTSNTTDESSIHKFNGSLIINGEPYLKDKVCFKVWMKDVDLIELNTGDIVTVKGNFKYSKRGNGVIITIGSPVDFTGVGHPSKLLEKR